MEAYRRGIVATWKDEKGFGFIAPEGGGTQIFFHISVVQPGGVRPKAGQRVRFVVGTDARQRPKATLVLCRRRLAGETILAMAIAIALAVGLGLAVFGQFIPVWVTLVYIVLSIVTFFVYKIDKERARRGQHRIPEITLHILELLGGWPGALVAQTHYRHKNRKISYQAVFWVLVMLNLLTLAGGGALLGLLNL